MRSVPHSILDTVVEMASTETAKQYPGFASRAKIFFRAWLKEPGQISSLVPSSPALTEAIADRDAVRQANVVVDIGPGTGETSRALLAQMNDSAKLLAIEKSEYLMEPLRMISDPRVFVIHGDARFLRRHLAALGLPSPDVVVSGIPFSTVPDDIARQLIEEIDLALPSGGTFVAYQLSKKIEELANPRFGQPTIETVWLNLPPLRIYSWVKR
jgi:phosphatidylethanolamine/phosphatidyl-N-methylethanolamine N-methyltransferase